MDVAEAEWMKGVGVGNGRLQRLVEEKEHDILGLKAVLSQKY